MPQWDEEFSAKAQNPSHRETWKATLRPRVRPGESGGKRAALQTLREVRRCPADATASGARDFSTAFGQGEEFNANASAVRRRNNFCQRNRCQGNDALAEQERDRLFSPDNYSPD